MKRSRITKLTIFATILFSGVEVALADVFLDTGGAFTTIPVPGFGAAGISSNGQIVVGEIAGVNVLYSGGSVTTLSNFPMDENSYALGVNDNGQVVGYFYPPTSGLSQGYVDTGGSFTAINDPSPGVLNTVATGINDSGQVVGYFRDQSFRLHGFVDTGGIFTTLNDPDGAFTQPFGINNSGQIVGIFEDGGAGGETEGFLYSNGIYTTISDPTTYAGINDSGQIVGDGFLDSGGTFTTIDYPDAMSTQVSGIADSGQIVGNYILPVPPVPEPRELPVLAGCLVSLLAVTHRRKFRMKQS